MYKVGLGVEKSYKQATKWLILSAEQDNSDALFLLGMMNQNSPLMQSVRYQCSIDI
jgi:TPR repeat protein